MHNSGDGGFSLVRFYGTNMRNQTETLVVEHDIEEGTMHV